ncbi:MAG: 3'-5' exonuclease domain-containing protein 2 [Muribaculaceae bacterium]|nr:3'-5' exonuclease domain-containing protein 2 [Muribaculaceae bacterium]
MTETSTITKQQPAPTQPGVAISKEQLSQLPPEQFGGRIILVQDTLNARKAMAYLNDCSIVGFDTETRPSFRKGQNHQVALMQISTTDCCFLIRLNRLGFFSELREFLENPSITKIGLSLKDDFHCINRISHVEPKGFIELQQLVRDYMITDSSLAKIYAILFGTRISNSQRLSNWEATELTVPQQQYAALDAFACLRIYHYLKSGAFNPAGSPYFHNQ